MTEQHDESLSGPSLRAAALAKLDQARPDRAPPMDLMLHELQVHQIELEMQNEALRQAQSAMEQSRDRYVDLYEFAPVGYMTLNGDGMVEAANLTCAALLGMDRTQLLRQRFAGLVHVEDQERWTHQFIRLKNHATPLKTELRMRHNDGSLFHVQLDGTRQNTTPPGPVLIRLALTNISERIRLTAELEEYRSHLEQLVEQRTRELLLAKDKADTANRAKTTFLANMSHELRTPLSATMGLTELALRKASDPMQRDQLGKAKKASQHLLKVINDILDISKIEAERLCLETVVFNLATVLDLLRDLIEEQAATKGLVMTIQISPELAQLPLLGDALRIGQILLNLLGNAIKFTPAGQVTLAIRAVAKRPLDLTLRFEIQDSGIGISPEDQQRLFMAFEQADNSTTRQYGGTGLGLTISKRLIELMGGALGVESRPDHGSTFWFELRLNKAAVHPTPEVLPHVSAEQQLATGFRGARILLVDDEPISQEVFCTLLHEVGLQVDLAADGLQALNLAKCMPYDLILMDPDP